MEHFKYLVKMGDRVYEQRIMEEILRLSNFQGSDYIQPSTESNPEIQVGLTFNSLTEAEDCKARLERLPGVDSVTPERIIPGIPEYKKGK